MLALSRQQLIGMCRSVQICAASDLKAKKTDMKLVEENWYIFYAFIASVCRLSFGRGLSLSK